MLVSKRVKFYTVKEIQSLFMHNIQCQSEDTHCGDNHLKTKLEQVTVDPRRTLTTNQRLHRYTVSFTATLDEAVKDDELLDSKMKELDVVV